MTSNDRADYISGLRQLADALEQHPEVPLPYEVRYGMTIHFLIGGNPRENMAAVAKVLPCDWHKDVSGDYFDLLGALGGLQLKLTAFRDAVCERVVTGTREVAKKIKDPEALAAVPEVEVTETVEDIEWRCHPVLAPAVSS